MNKRVFFLLIVVLTTSCYMHAQVSFGVSAGVNLSNFINEDNKSLTFKPGFQAGVLANIAFNDILSLQPGLQFSQMGAQEKEDGDALIINLNYLQLPVNLQAKFGNFFVQAGPYLGYGLNVRTTFKSDGKNVSTTNSFEVADLKPFDFGMGAGLGFQFGHVQTALNSKFGLANINEDSYSVRNIGLALTVTVFFGQ